MIEADTYSYWVLVGFFFFFFFRIRLGWAFGYLFRIDVGLFLGLLCKIQTNLFCKIIRFYNFFFFFGGAKSYTFGFGQRKIFFFLDFSSKFVCNKNF